MNDTQKIGCGLLALGAMLMGLALMVTCTLAIF